MAQLVHRDTGRDGSLTPTGRPARITERPPDTREGREAADALARRLDDAKRFYDVSIFVNGNTRMQSFTRKDADNLLAAEITVTRQLDRNRNLVEPKSAAGERTFAIPRWLAEELAAHLARRGLTARDGDALVFSGAKGGPLNYSAWRRTLWAPACEQAGLTGLGFHDLRRANATALVAANADPKVAQTRLGHSDVRLTLGLYADVTPEADRLAADAVGAWLRPVVPGVRDRNAIKAGSGLRRSQKSVKNGS